MFTPKNKKEHMDGVNISSWIQDACTHQEARGIHIITSIMTWKTFKSNCTVCGMSVKWSYSRTSLKRYCTKRHPVLSGGGHLWLSPNGSKRSHLSQTNTNLSSKNFIHVSLPKSILVVFWASVCTWKGQLWHKMAFFMLSLFCGTCINLSPHHFLRITA